MSIPKSRVLSVSKGFGLGAEFHNNSPTSTQVVNVNIDKTFQNSNLISQNKEISERSERSENVSEPVYPSLDSNPYNFNDKSKHVDKTEQVQYPNENTILEEQKKKLEELLKYKENVIEALTSLLSIIEANPLIINKCIIAKLEDLAQLIKLLTEADNVQINTDNDVACSCFKDLDFVHVDKIYVVKNNETLNFKYSFPDANKILHDHHVSVKLVRV